MHYNWTSSDIILELRMALDINEIDCLCPMCDIFCCGHCESDRDGCSPTSRTKSSSCVTIDFIQSFLLSPYMLSILLNMENHQSSKLGCIDNAPGHHSSVRVYNLLGQEAEGT